MPETGKATYNVAAITEAVERLMSGKRLRAVDYLLIGQVIHEAQARGVVTTLIEAQGKAVEEEERNAA